ncbi:MAG: DUF996 domain-containing protein [Candidatus Bathyarchaeota archaeon]|nr:DUF996 domain-containing protein [Candidatus Bathyarchaeota archaeon]
MTIESSKNLGGIGAILLFIGAIPLVSYLWIVSFVGAVLVLVALHGFANFYRERGIFNNALYGVIAGIVGGVAAVTVAFTVILANIEDLMYELFPGWNGDWSSIQGMTPDPSNIDVTKLIPFLIGILAVVAIVWIFSIIAAFFVRRSLKQVSDKTKTGLFGTAGLLLLIGAALIIVFGLGFILMWIAALILAIAFFNMKIVETAPDTTGYTPPPTPV